MKLIFSRKNKKNLCRIFFLAERNLFFNKKNLKIFSYFRYVLNTKLIKFSTFIKEIYDILQQILFLLFFISGADCLKDNEF